MNRKFDWQAIEKQYVQGDMGLRELARQHGITNHSLIMVQSKRNGWVGKRELFRSSSEAKALELMTTEEGRRIARESRVRDNAVDAIDELITRLREDLRKTKKVMRDGVWTEEPLVVVTPQHVALMIDRLQVLFGKPSSISEERNLGLSLSATTDPDFLRALVDATRGVASVGGSGSPLPRLEDARKN